MKPVKHKKFFLPLEALFTTLLFVMLSVNVFPFDSLTADTLAVVGEKIITSEDFTQAYKDKLTRIGLTDNLETRRQYLLNLINDELLIAEAKIKQLDKVPQAEKEHNRITIQELLNAYSLVHISPFIEVTENDLKDLFIKMNTRIKVSHLYAAEKENADILYRRLSNGESFENLAKETFSDPSLRNTGGSLGYITIDEMDPDFETAAYSLRVGEISQPVKTVHGYSIIKVDDIKSNPLVTENEFLKARERLMSFASKRAFEAASKEHAKLLREKLNTRFNEGVLNKLYASVQNNSLEISSEAPFSIQPDEMNNEIVSSSLGKWTVADLINEMEYTSDRQKKFIKTKENLKDFVAGLVNRKFILQQAYKEKLDELASVQKKIEFNYNTWLLTEIENQLKSKIKISPDSVKAYYNSNIEKFKTEPEIRLSSILTDRIFSADSIKKLLTSGSDFGELAKEYSIQSFTSENGGDMGFFKRGELDNLAADVFNLKTGEWAGPFSDDGKYVFLKCTDIKESRTRSFKECSEEIEKNLEAFEWFSFRDKYVDSLKEKIPVTIFFEKLNKADLLTKN